MKVLPEVLPEVLLLLQMLVTIEARGEPMICQQLVHDVVMARVKDDRWPDTLYGVLSQKGQFPWWKDRKNIYSKVPELEKTKASINFMSREARNTNFRFFYNPKKTDTDPMKSANIIAVCGNHYFKALETNILD